MMMSYQYHDKSCHNCYGFVDIVTFRYKVFHVLTCWKWFWNVKMYLFNIKSFRIKSKIISGLFFGCFSGFLNAILFCCHFVRKPIYCVSPYDTGMIYFFGIPPTPTFHSRRILALAHISTDFSIWAVPK